MHIWLINPPVQRGRPSAIETVVQSVFYNSPPLGLAYIAAVLEQAGHRVTITDCPVEGMRLGDLSLVARQLWPDLVGITATTPYWDQAQATGEVLRRVLPDRHLVLGGPHLNANPGLLLENLEYSLGVRGEGDFAMLEIVQAVESGADPAEVPGVVSVREGELYFAAERPLIEDLDLLPFPARHLLPIHRYRPLANDEYQLPKTAAITSRGCPFQCTFCAKHTHGSRYRAYSPGRVVQELHHLEQRYGIRDIAFVDSTFMPTRKRILAILDAMEADPPRASWTCSCRANVLDEGIVRRMRAMGCWRVRIGIESGNADVLRSIRKGVTREQCDFAVRTAAAAGLQVKAFFMVGHVHDTPETVEETIRFAMSLPLKDVTVQINTPLPGTGQYEEAKTNGTLQEGDTSRYSFFEPVYLPAAFSSPDQLLAAQKSFYRRFYLRPQVFWRHLSCLRGVNDVAKYARAVPLVLNLMLSRGS